MSGIIMILLSVIIVCPTVLLLYALCNVSADADERAGYKNE